MAIHPFMPEIPTNATKLIVGTLPPEEAPFYFSNSSNTRLWDILYAIQNESKVLSTGGFKFSEEKKIAILENLNIGIADIIYEYERVLENSVKDVHIIPLIYNDLVKLALDNNIDELLFVYQSAYKWFLHSLKKEKPAILTKVSGNFVNGDQEITKSNGRVIKCTLLPSPLNRGRKNETLAFKLETYKRAIKSK